MTKSARFYLLLTPATTYEPGTKTPRRRRRNRVAAIKTATARWRQ